MEQTRFAFNRKTWPVLAAAALLLLGLVFSKQIYFAWLDISFYWSERTEEELKVKAYAEEMGLSIGEYPGKIIDFLEQNPEAEEFVFRYPFREEYSPDLSRFSGTTGVPLFLQWDTDWGYVNYGSDMIAITGCGPTCLAMAGYYLTGDEIFTPDQVAAFAEENGYYAEGYGSSWTLISQGGVELGLTVTELPLDKDVMINALEEGFPIILAMGKGDFTSSGHYIVLTDFVDGAFRVNDPNSILRSQRLWTYERIESQIRNIWKIEA